jgi:hypothetical protein
MKEKTNSAKVRPAGVIFDEDKKPEPEEPKPKSVCENIMSKIS